MQPKLPFQKYLFFLFIVIVLTTTLNACTTSPWWVKFVLIDKNLKDLVISDVSRTPTRETDDLLRVDVILQNTSSESITAVYKFFWLDENGVEIQGLASSLQTVHVLPRRRTQIFGIAPSQQVKQFRLQMYSPRRIIS